MNACRILFLHRGIMRVKGRGKVDGKGLNYDPPRNLWIGEEEEEGKANARDSR